MQEQHRCMLCGDRAYGFIETSLGWRGKPVTRVYLCRKHYRIMYQESRDKWYELNKADEKRK
jgi:hypothetical protein